MLALQTLTIALTLSYAQASPLAGLYPRAAPSPRAAIRDTTDLALAGRDPGAPPPAAVVRDYAPPPLVTSLTARYYEERATCVDQFVWYCSALGGACLAAIPGLETPLALLSCIPCVLAAACVGITLLIGILCCNGIIKNCDQTSTASIDKIAATFHDMPLDIQTTLNGQNSQSDAPFTKDTFKPVFFNQVNEWKTTQQNLTDADFDGVWKNFTSHIFPGNANPPTSIDIDTLNNYLKGKIANAI